ncbi:ER membrane glycoprotein subunit of the GPI transamidase complex-like protein, partial [Coelomomyces lativittatus]
PQLRFILYSLLLFVPFFNFERYIYQLYCVQSTIPRDWCHSTLGLSYSVLQKQYWNVGLFEYWRFEKLPDISVSIPVYLRSFQQLLYHFTHLRSLQNPLLPYLLLHLFLCLSAIFIFHVQIVIRMFSSMPPLFLVTSEKGIQGWWLWYTLFQSSIGAVMFSAFFGPP